jgi:hypothetical protein
MFIRCKRVKGQTYHQVVESVRTNGTVRQRVVVALGRSSDPVEALKSIEIDLDLSVSTLHVLARRERAAPEKSPEYTARLKQRERLQARIAKLTEILEQGLLPPFRMPRRRRRRR